MTKNKNIVFEQIKKQNGEHFAKTIRSFDNGIFDVPGIADVVKYAGREAEPILNYLVSLKKIHIDTTPDYKDPIQLLDEAGYRAYYVHNLDEQNAIMPYFAPGEQLCTFYDQTRFQKFHIINAVKKNVQEIKREDFVGHEEREDAYGTSVISIQILRTGGFISIKNRYNHIVENADNTFNSNPDNIIKGLSNALRQKFKVDFSSQVTVLPENYTFVNGQIIKYHAEMGGRFIGSDVIVDYKGDVTPIDKNTEIILDYWLFNIKDRTLENLAPLYYRDDAFPLMLKAEIEGKSVQLIKNPDHSHTLLADGQPVLTEKEGEIIELTIRQSDKNLRLLNYPFLEHNTKLQTLNIPNIRAVGNDFLSDNIALQNLHAPKLRKVGDNFLSANKMLHTIDLPQLRMAGDCFIDNNVFCHTFNAPNLTKAGDFFLSKNKFLRTLKLPNLKSTGTDFLVTNKILHQFEAPKLKEIDDCFLENNQELINLDLPEVQQVGDEFLSCNTKLQHLNAPKLSYVGTNFLEHNLCMRKLSLPALKTAESFFMYKNEDVQLHLPKLIPDCICNQNLIARAFKQSHDSR